MAVTFFFGSGADTDYYKNLPSGKVFTETLITEKYNYEVSQMVNLKDKSGFRILYPQSSKMYIQTVYENQEAAKDNLDNKKIDLCIRYYNGDSSINYNKDIQPLCKDWFDILMDGAVCDEKDKKIKAFFLTNGVFFDSLDEKFNSLRYNKLNSNAKRLIKAYATIFILMLKKLYNLNPEGHEDNFNFSYENIFNKLNKKYDIKEEKTSYYKDLAEEFKEEEYYVATTNYTNLVSDCIKKDVIYLHGKMTWFEDLKNLTVYDCSISKEREKLSEILNEKDNEEIMRIIPFIMISSGVKPIICTRQIKEYAKFLDGLYKSNIICVVGYRFNSEDNHINSIIAEWLDHEDNKLIYLNFAETEDDSQWERMMEKPWIKDRFSYEQINDINGLLDNKNKILLININENNSNHIFKKLLQVLKKKN